MLSNKEELEENRKKLNKLIEDNAPLEEIQKQSEVLDKYITIYYNQNIK